LIALGSFMFGYDTGVISGALLFIKHDLGLSDFQQGTVVSVLLIGAIIGALSEGRIADRIGRRAALRATPSPPTAHGGASGPSP
jgi:MFS family permease